MTTQTEDVAITEEDLELIRERETNIRQLEVCLRVLFIITQFKNTHLHNMSTTIDTGFLFTLIFFFLLSLCLFLLSLTSWTLTRFSRTWQ